MSTSTTPAATQSSVSESNRAHLLQHLYHQGTSSRAQIAKALNLTPAAITKITARLIDAGVIEETNNFKGSANNRSIGLALDPTRFHVIGVKIARSLVLIGTFDLTGKRLNLTTLECASNDAIAATINAIHSTINQLIKQDSSIVAIGFAIPGPYLREVGRIAVVSGMQGWRRINFRKEFGAAFSVPVFIEQDARAGALAQYLFASDVSSPNLAYYLIGEGVGLGVIDHGQLINGIAGAATEIGHVSIDINGPLCDCGNRGCLETTCSARAIHDLINTSSLIDNSASMSHAEACRALFTLAKQGNVDAQALVRHVGTYVGYGCVTIINAFNPEHIIIGDIVAEAGPLLLHEAQSVVNERVIPELADLTAISLSTLPTDATVSGAAAVAITQFLEHPSMFFDIA